jgi:hypothetical protein
MSKQQTTTSKQSVANPEQLLQRFERERADLVERKAALADRRRDHAYDAAAGNAAAAKQLDAVHREAVEIESRIANSDAAIAEAKHRLEIAREHEAKAANRERALAIRQQWTEAAADFSALDQGLDGAADAARRLYDRYEIMQQHGLRVPPQLTLMFTNVVVAALMAMPPPLWRELNHLGLEYLPPNRRRSAASLRAAWDLQVQNQAAAIGGEPATPEAA